MFPNNDSQYIYIYMSNTIPYRWLIIFLLSLLYCGQYLILLLVIIVDKIIHLHWVQEKIVFPKLLKSYFEDYLKYVLHQIPQFIVIHI